MPDPEPSPTSRPRPDVPDLLAAYAAALKLARNPPATLVLPPMLKPLEVLLRKLRPVWGTEMWTRRHIRRRLDVLTRAYATNLAAGESTSSDDRDLEALERFESAVARPASRLPVVLGAVVALLLGQVIFNAAVTLLANTGFVSDDALQQTIASLDIAPQVGVFSHLGRAVFESDAATLLAFITALTITLYVFLRPLAPGFRISLWTLDSRERLPPWRAKAYLQTQARSTRLDSIERAVFLALDARAPSLFPLDVVAKALILMPPLYFVAYAVDVSPNDLPPAFWPLLVVIAARALMLVAQLRLRSVTIAWLAVPIAVVAIAAVVAEEPGAAPERLRAMNDSFFKRSQAAPDEISIERRPSDQLRTNLSPRGNLNGVDLRGRSLYAFYFAGKDMNYAQLSYADLQQADFFSTDLESAVMTGVAAHGIILQRSDLRYASLAYADLRDADLRWADLRDADLRGANLSRADLTGAKLQRAQLASAWLLWTRLRGTDLRKSRLATAVFACTDLDGADLRHAKRPAPSAFGATWNKKTKWTGKPPRPDDYAFVGLTFGSCPSGDDEEQAKAKSKWIPDLVGGPDSTAE